MAKCLVVDDDIDMLQILVEYVETLGFEGLKARDGDQAWEIFRRENPNVVISDIHMPNRNGLLLMRDVKTHAPNVPVILITGYFQYRRIVKGLQPDAYLEKPFSFEDLRAALERVFPLDTVTS